MRIVSDCRCPRLRFRFVPSLLVLLCACLAGILHGQNSPFVNFEGKQTRPACLSPDGTRLFVVNTPDARLSVFDLTRPLDPILIAEIPVGLEPVSVRAQDNDTVWVVSEVSDAVSVVSVSRRVVTDTLQVKDEPADVVFANGKAFISAARRNQITVADATSHVILTNIALKGENPRALALSPDGGRLYAAFALSGNRTTIVPFELAPPQPMPTNTQLPPPPRVSLIVDATDPLWSTGAQAPIRYTMPDNDVVEIDTETLEIVRYIPRVGSVNLGLAVHPGSGDLWVANTDAHNLEHFETNLRGTFVDNRVSHIDITNGAVTHHDLNQGFTYQGFPNAAERALALAQPTDLVFEPDGNHMFVASFGTDRVAWLDDLGTVLERIELNPDTPDDTTAPRTKRGPRGLALLPGQALYVVNRLANSISILDAQTRELTREIPVGSHDPTPPVIREGRGFLYDAKLSGAGTVSCASCHIDAEMDLLAWDLGDPGGEMQPNQIGIAPPGPTIPNAFHPMKGPMTTQTLRGLKGLEPLHWRGDRSGFLAFNGAFDSLLGGGELSAQDMEAYRDFIETVRFQPNPNQNLDRSLPTSFPTKNGIGNPQAGRNSYINEPYTGTLTCNTCHVLPTGSAPFIVAAQALQEPQDIKIPHLRNIYQKLNVDFAPDAESVGGFGLVHDGVDPDLFTFLSRDVFDNLSDDTVRKRNIDAFVQCLDTGTAPGVGHTRTVTPGNAENAETVAAWNLLEGQAGVLTNIDLIVKGTFQGRHHGLYFNPGTRLYEADQNNLGPFTRDELNDLALAGDTFTLMGVPPGTGVRMGIDRNDNLVPDGNEPAPSLAITRTTDETLVSWPVEADGYVLEQAGSLPDGPWTPNTDPRTVQDGQVTITTTTVPAARFFRLRSL